MQPTMTIDIETYSSNAIKKGVCKYVDAPSFDILLFAYAIDDEPVNVIEPAKDRRRLEHIMPLLYDKGIIKRAYNAAFEITCLNAYLTRHGYKPLDVSQWQCDMIAACYNGYPAGLGITAKALGLPEDKQKDTRGKRLIRYFCMPCKPTKSNGGRTRNLPEDAPEDWEVFKEYNAQDVVTERAIARALKIQPPEMEWKLWRMDLEINGRGIGIDGALVNNAIAISQENSEKLTQKAREITGLENPNSPVKLKEWLAEKGIACESLSKDAVKDILARDDIPVDARRVLMLRKKLAKTSIKKYQAMQETVTSDGRAHNLFQFYGTHTGRWAGRNIQLQNLPRNSMPDLGTARELVRAGDLDTLDMLYDDIPDTLSQLIRTALIPSEGNRFIVADFSAIEARVIAWAADVKWRQAAFGEGKDIYCQSASMMFGVPVEKHGINGHLRQKGKIAELALGYGGGIGALKAFGADKMGLSDDELQEIVTKWRAASPEIPELWSSMETAAFHVIQGVAESEVFCRRLRTVFFMSGKDLCMRLPSGRLVVYPNARIGKNRFGKESVIYDGLNQVTRKWGGIETYGGRLVENFIQSVARDCLAAAMYRLEAAGYHIVAHIHDEVIIDAPKEQGSLDDAIRIMTRNEPWNEGLLMNADGFEGEYYRKE